MKAKNYCHITTVVFLFSIAALLLTTQSGCLTKVGAAVGTVSGTGAGAVAGTLQGRPMEGAAAGAKAGAVGGGVVGKIADTIILAPIRVPAKLFGRKNPSFGLTAEDVIQMKKSGASDDEIIRQIDLVGMKKPLTAGAVKKLAEHNVGTPIVVAMQGHSVPRFKQPKSSRSDSETTDAPEQEFRTAADPRPRSRASDDLSPVVLDNLRTGGPNNRAMAAYPSVAPVDRQSNSFYGGYDSLQASRPSPNAYTPNAYAPNGYAMHANASNVRTPYPDREAAAPGRPYQPRSDYAPESVAYQPPVYRQPQPPYASQSRYAEPQKPGPYASPPTYGTQPSSYGSPPYSQLRTQPPVRESYPQQRYQHPYQSPAYQSPYPATNTPPYR